MSFYSGAGAAMTFYAYQVNYPGDGYSDPGVAAQTIQAHWVGTDVTSQSTTSFYYGGYSNATGYTPLDISAAGYDAFMQKAALHEAGHTMGLADNNTGGGNSGQSVMNPQLGTNDIYSNMASFLTACDNAALPIH